MTLSSLSPSPLSLSLSRCTLKEQPLYNSAQERVASDEEARGRKEGEQQSDCHLFTGVAKHNIQHVSDNGNSLRLRPIVHSVQEVEEDVHMVALRIFEETDRGSAGVLQRRSEFPRGGGGDGEIARAVQEMNGRKAGSLRYWGTLEAKDEKTPRGKGGETGGKEGGRERR